MINTSKKFFKNLSVSFDDKRAKIIYEDASKWIERNIKQFANYFDVVIADITDFNASESLVT